MDRCLVLLGLFALAVGVAVVRSARLPDEAAPDDHPQPEAAPRRPSLPFPAAFSMN